MYIYIYICIYTHYYRLIHIYIYILILQYCYMYINTNNNTNNNTWLLTKIPLSGNGHSSRIKMLLSRTSCLSFTEPMLSSNASYVTCQINYAKISRPVSPKDEFNSAVWTRIWITKRLEKLIAWKDAQFLHRKTCSSHIQQEHSRENAVANDKNLFFGPFCINLILLVFDTLFREF